MTYHTSLSLSLCVCVCENQQKVLGAPFDVAFRGTVGVACAAFLIIAALAIASKLSDWWDMLQLTIKLLNRNDPPAPQIVLYSLT